MDTRYKMLKIQSRESCIREYRRIPKEWIQDTKCWRYKVQEHVSENTGGYINNGYRIQNIEDTKYRILYQRIQENTWTMDTGYKMLKIQSTGTCIREYWRIPKQKQNKKLKIQSTGSYIREYRRIPDLN